jgi:general secretion pathway protein M
MKAEAEGNAMQMALAPVGAWWRALPLRERRLALLAGGVLLAFLLWTLAIQPAWRTIATAPAELDELEAQLQGMQRLAGEVTQLRATPPVNPELAAAALKAATERLGEQGKLSLQGERAVLTVNGVATSDLRDWLAEARSGARARPVEANLLRSGPGLSGTLVLSLGGGL